MLSVYSTIHLSAYKYLVAEKIRRVSWVWNTTRNSTSTFLRLSTLKSTRSYARVARGTCVRKSMNDITIVDSVIDPGSPVHYWCCTSFSDFFFIFQLAMRTGRVAVGDDQLAIKFCIVPPLSSFVLNMRWSANDTNVFGCWPFGRCTSDACAFAEFSLSRIFKS